MTNRGWGPVTINDKDTRGGRDNEINYAQLVWNISQYRDELKLRPWNYGPSTIGDELDSLLKEWDNNVGR